MNIKAIVVDDEIIARKAIIELIEDYQNIEVMGEASSAEEALEIIKTKKPNVVFLDIQLPGFNGVEFVELLNRLEEKVLVVFISAYDEYALDAFEVDAVDYLMKPVSPERFAVTVERIEKVLAKEGVLEKVPVKEDNLLEMVDLEEIFYFESMDKKVYLHTKEDELEVYRYNLSELESSLPSFFARVHKSFIVNLKKVRRFSSWPGSRSYFLTLSNGKEIPIGKNYKSKIKKLLHL